MFRGYIWQNVLSFDEAISRHGMLVDVLDELTKGKLGQFDQKTMKTIVGYMQDAWNECMGAGDPDSVMASALRAIIPLDYVPLLCMRSGIPAAYLVVRLAKQLAHAARAGKDLSDDMVLRKVAVDAFGEFEYKRQNADKMEQGFGYDRSEAWAQMRKVEDKSKDLAHMMERIAELAGRMFKAFRYQGAPRKCDDPQEVDGVETGGHIERMLDDEAASMGIDPEVAVRVSDERAYQYQMSGLAAKSRGPLIIVLDESDSMHEHREVWSKACAVALTRVALAEGRAVRVVHFSTGTDVHDVRPGNADDMRLVAESHVSGGTDIEMALRVALQQVGDLEKNGQEGADLVFITDGCATYGEHHFKVMLKEGIQLWTVAIDVDIKRVAEENKRGWGFYGGASGHLYTYARAYVHIDDQAILSPKGIDAVLQLRDAALDNLTREVMR